MAAAGPTEHEETLNEYIALWNGDSSDTSVVDESIVVTDPGRPEPVRGRNAFAEHIDGIRTGFPDFHVAVDEMLARDDVLMVQWTVTGTHEGEFEGVPATGKGIEMHGMDKLRIEDGRVREHRIHYDTHGLMAQLGLTDE